MFLFCTVSGIQRDIGRKSPEASTHKSAKTHAGDVLWLATLTFWPRNKGASGIHRATVLCHVWSSVPCGKTDRQTDRQTGRHTNKREIKTLPPWLSSAWVTIYLFFNTAVAWQKLVQCAALLSRMYPRIQSAVWSRCAAVISMTDRTHCRCISLSPTHSRVFICHRLVTSVTRA